MPAAFARCLESIEPRGRARHLSSALAGALLAGWAAWFFGGEVAVFRGSDAARVEASVVPRPLVAEAAGRVVTSGLVLGRSVAEGDVLLELDPTSARLQLAEEKARRDAVASALGSARLALRIEEELTNANVAVAAANARTASVQRDAAKSLLSLSDDELSRVRSLNDAALLPTLQRIEREMSHVERAASVAREAAAAQRAAAEIKAADRGGKARVQELEREIVDLDGRLELARALIARLEHDVDRHTVRAPASGVLGDVVPAPAGDYVTAAQRLGTVVPEGPLRVVAEFAAEGAAGVVRPGQPAVMRLDSAAAAGRAMVPLQVTSVAEVAREGRLRVELDGDRGALALVHGQTGVVEVEVARTSPVDLALRLAGQAYAGLSKPGAGPAEPQRGGER
ncbi:HlyD family efflux transporter periplasmic adaptor subunit [Sorangium sp. So ce1153]|uniref:HlyD family efflux transporter periplasmic adaptor subunit n=1 Tax=Sorangium sp. So ce1153 TaxID=3133333 RepID=UPI003F6314E8